MRKKGKSSFTCKISLLPALKIFHACVAAVLLVSAGATK